MIFNTVIQGSVAGINGDIVECIATENIQKGDFIQLKSLGVEEVSLNTHHTNILNVNYPAVTVSVMSPTLVITVWSEQVTAMTGSTGADGIGLIYVNLTYKKDGTWQTSHPLLLYVNPITPTPQVVVEPLTDNKAIVYVQSSISSAYYSRIFVIDVTDRDNIVVEAEITSPNRGSYSAGRTYIFPVSPTKFAIIATKDAADCHGYLYSYTDGQITAIWEGKLITADFWYACKLNSNNQILCASSDPAYYYVLTINDDNISATRTTLAYASAVYGPMVYWKDNIVVTGSASVDDRQTYAPRFINYDPESGDLTFGDYLLDAGLDHVSFDIAKISDDKLLYYVATSTTATSAIPKLGILDVANRTITLKELPFNISGASKYMRQMDLNYGLMAVIGYDRTNETFTLYTAPVVTQTTVTKQKYRIDGVAIKSAEAGQTIKLVVPVGTHIATGDSIDSTTPEDETTTEGDAVTDPEAS